MESRRPQRRAREIIQPLREKQALITTRTRQALSAAKARGVTLGNPRLQEARKNAVGAVKAEADRYAANVLPIIREAQKAGARTLREIAEALNARGIATARGGQWLPRLSRTSLRGLEKGSPSGRTYGSTCPDHADFKNRQ